MTFDKVVTMRCAFANRREMLLTNWLLSHSIGSANVTHWAARLEETNDAEMAFAALVNHADLVLPKLEVAA